MCDEFGLARKDSAEEQVKECTLVLIQRARFHVLSVGRVDASRLRQCSGITTEPSGYSRRVTDAEVIRAVLLGDPDPSRLIEAGFAVTFSASGSSISEPDGIPTVSASVEEVANGYVAAWAAGSESLRHWAQLVLGINALDLSSLEENADGARLLEAVWDAMAGRADGLDLATRLA